MSEILGPIIGFAGDFAPYRWADCDGGLVSSGSGPGYVSLVGDSFGGDGVNNAATPSLADFPAREGPSVKKILSVNGNLLPDTTFMVGQVLEAIDTERLTENGIWLECDGRSLNIDSNQGLFSLLGNRYGSQSAQTFHIPELPPEPTLDGKQSVKYLLSAKGYYPGSYPPYPSFIGQVQYNPMDFSPPGWFKCDGRTLSIEEPQYQKLFNVLTTRYGGDGRYTFAIPNLLPLLSSNGSALQPIICVDGVLPQHSLQPR